MFSLLFCCEKPKDEMELVETSENTVNKGSFQEMVVSNPIDDESSGEETNDS